MKNIRVDQEENEDRRSYLLRVASVYILTHCPDQTMIFDDAVCDGACLAEDCLNEAEAASDQLDAANKEIRLLKGDLEGTTKAADSLYADNQMRADPDYDPEFDR